jgi:3-phenylpropionate/trans-cinnamate dioxygenase ferredoxin reductase component
MHYKYLIIGGGMTADAATRGIRKVDSSGSIGLISSDSHPPYDRPPLTKGLWKGKPFDSIWRGTTSRDVDLFLGRRAQNLDPERKCVVDDQGVFYTYDQLLLATGGTPRRFSFGGDRIIYYRTLDDYKHLRALVDRGGRFAVIGSGFIGSEIAAALAMNSQEVVMIFPEDTIGARMYPDDLSLFLNDFYRLKGVKLIPSAHINGFELHDGQPVLKTQSQEVICDHIVAGLGIQPNVELAEFIGLKVDNGIMVDEFLRTSHPDVYAAGDVASFYNQALGKHIRVEHEDNANIMGQVAGLNMAGESTPYNHLPFFYSDLFELGYEAVGELDSRLEIVEDWKDPYREGIIYYTRNGRVRGVLLWNIWNQVDAARRLIGEPGPFLPKDLKGRLPETS